jgi:endonuclease/exonuclease/phosphatase family metal-dependent hydrolase
MAAPEKKRKMRPWITGLVLILVVWGVAACTHRKVLETGAEKNRPASSGDLRLRVLTYNIRHGEGSDGQVDLERTARVIREARADIVALQEVDCKTSRVKGVDQAEELARLTGMRVAFGRAIDLGGGQYGNAILTRLEEVRPPRTFPLPGGEKRALLWMDLKAPGGEFAFLATHLDLNAQRREESVEQIEKLFGDRLKTPALLAGDLNAEFPETAFQNLLRSWENTEKNGASAEPSCPADHPANRIDHVLFRPASRWRVVECRVLPEPEVSDHRPVLVVLELLPGE